MHLGEGAQPAAGPAAAGATPPGGDAVASPTGAGTPGSTDEDLVRQASQGDHEAFAELVRRHHGMVYNLCLRLVGQAADAADVTQEAFLRAYTRLGAFRGQGRFRTWLYRIAINACRDELRRRRRRPWPWAALSDALLAAGAGVARPGRRRRVGGAGDAAAGTPREGTANRGGRLAGGPSRRQPAGEGPTPSASQGSTPFPVRGDAGPPAPGSNPEAAVLASEVRAAVAAALATLPEPFRVAVVLRDLHDLSYEEIAAVLGVPPGTVRSRIHRGRLLLRDALTRAGWAPGSGGEA
ncbi:MAG TPA: sigma-70 family RNA polymerase sigma factor [Thermaerobacter sp.]